MTHDEPYAIALPARRSCHWSHIPSISATSIDRAQTGQTYVRQMLAQAGADIALVVLSGEKKPRRRADVSCWSIGMRYLTPMQHDAIEPYANRIGASYHHLAKELLQRWPENAQPDAIAFASDGEGLMFNAGAPGGKDGSWITRHLDGSSPAALILPGDRLMQLCPGGAARLKLIEGGKKEP